MVKKPALLVVIGVTLFGCLGGLIAALARPTHYQADAIVIVYEMSHDLRELIGPDQAQQLDDVYAAGALQPKVVQSVLPQFPGMTEKQLRGAVQVSIIAYTPLTRVTAIASTPEGAAALANAVAVGWTTVARSANDNAYTTTLDTLTKHEHDLYIQIDATRKAIVIAANTEGAAGTPPLNKQLEAQLQQVTKTDQTIVSLDKYRAELIGNAYVTTPATADSATRTTDPIKFAALGAVGGLALGFLFLLWIVRRQRFQQPPDAVRRTVGYPDAWASPVIETPTGDGYGDRYGGDRYGDRYGDGRHEW